MTPQNMPPNTQIVNFLRLFPLLLTPLLHADIIEGVPVTLQLDPEVSRVTHDFGVTFFGSDSAVSQISGTIEAVISFDDKTGQLTKAEATGGNISLAPVELNLRGPIGSTIDVAISEISASFQSPQGPEILENDEGRLDPERHFVVPSSGTISLSSSLAETETIDVTEPDPDGLVDAEAITVIEDLVVTLVRGEALGNNRQTWTVTLVANGDTSTTQEEDGITGTYRARTNFVASETITTLDSFGRWLGRNELPIDSSFQSVGSSSLNLGLLHAFDLSEATAALPLNFTRSLDEGITLRVLCPEDGLLRPVGIEFLPNLGQLNDPPVFLTTLESGRAGECLVPLPASPKGFIRLRALPSRP